MNLAGVWLLGLLAIEGVEPSQRIEWQAGEGCPSQAAVVEATSAYLGGALASFSRAVIAHARVEAGPAGYRLGLSITVDGRSERHEIASADCDQLGRDAALLIASAVDPLALGPRPAATRQLLVTPVEVQRPRTRSKPEAPSIAAPSPPIPAPPSPEPPLAVELAVVDRPEPPLRESRRPVSGTLGLAGTTFAGLFPQIGGGVELEGGLHRGLFRWQIGAAGWFGGRFRAPDSEIGGDLWAISASTGFCVTPGRARVRFHGCAVAGAGAITVTSVNTDAQRQLARPWGFAGPDLRVIWTPRKQLGLYVGIAALPALVRPGWSVRNPDASFRVPAVAGLLRVGVELGSLGAR